MLFQAHLWVGIGTGLYIFIIGLSGSLVVFRREIDRALCPEVIAVSPTGRRFHILCEPGFVTWMVEFHDHLGAGRTGLLINGLGAIVVTLMCLTGAVLWWPGRARWRRSLTLHRGISARRFIWELHGVLGFWTLLLLLMWALTSIYFAFPGPFNALDDRLMSARTDTHASQLWEATIEWLVRLHFGRAFGLPVEILWVVLGLVPCGLFVTGVLVWWNRVLRPASRLASDDQRVIPAAGGESLDRGEAGGLQKTP